MGSGAIYAAIVALWALVLIPMWLRRHDEANQSRSIDRYKGAMRSLSGRSSAASSREILMPARSRSVDVVVTGARRAESPGRPSASVLAARSRAAARRRRVLGGLLVLLVAVVVLALVHRAPAWAVLVPVALLGAFGLAVRRQVQAQSSLDRRLARGASLRARAEQAETDASGRRRRAHEVRPGGRVVEPEPVRARAQGTRRNDSWDAVSAPLPTYVTAPAASRVPRVIDLTHPGHWTGAAMVEEVQRARASAAPASEPLFDQADPVPGGSFSDRFVDDDVVLGLDDEHAFFDQMDEQAAAPHAVEHRRAVNG